MPINGYTIGRDVTVTIAGPGGQAIVIPANQVTGFNAKPLKREEWARPLNSPPQPIYTPDGWRGTIDVDRQDATLDTFQSNLEAAFWGGQNTLSGTVLETITEDDGSITQYQYNSVMYWVEDPGSYRTENLIKQRMEFCAGQRIRVA